jgi:hypothetical protein
MKVKKSKGSCDIFHFFSHERKYAPTCLLMIEKHVAKTNEISDKIHVNTDEQLS